MMARKLRRDAWWAPLSEGQCWALYERGKLLRPPEHEPLVREVCGEEFPPPPIRAWYAFLAKMREQDAVLKIHDTLVAGKEAFKLSTLSPGISAVANALLSLAAESAMRTKDPKAAAPWTRQAEQLLRIDQQERELRLREAAQALAEKRFEALVARDAAARATIADAAATPEEREARLREIFHLADPGAEPAPPAD